MAALQNLLAGGNIGKTWQSAGECLADHAVILRSHPRLLGSYLGLGGAAIEPEACERVMVAVNSVTQCPYCTRLHGNLARIAGVEDEGETAPEVYARKFGKNGGRGPAEAEAFEVLIRSEGEARAASVRALALFLLWGSYTGNAVNDAKKMLVGKKPFAFSAWHEVLLMLYYGPLFFLVFVVGAALSALPAMPGQMWFFKLMGFTLTALSFLWILPLGAVGMVLGAATDLRGEKTERTKQTRGRDLDLDGFPRKRSMAVFPHRRVGSNGRDRTAARFRYASDTRGTHCSENASTKTRGETARKVGAGAGGGASDRRAGSQTFG
jgi:AhpD family alkylhydroperoxidase